MALIWPGSCSISGVYLCVNGNYQWNLVRQIGTVIKCGVLFLVLVMLVHNIFTNSFIV